MISERIELYEGRHDVSLTTYVRDNSPEMPGGMSRGAVLICPGGAYLGCSDREAEPVAMAFNAMGYHAFVIRYSVYINGDGENLGPGKPMSPKPHCIFPNPVLDIANAMLYIGSKADLWHVDMDRVAVCGFSAGAHNAAMYSVYWNNPLITEALSVKAEKLKPAASILSYGVFDLVGITKGLNSMPDEQKWLMKGMFTSYFGTPEPSEELLEKASPVFHITKDMPSVFLWSTSEDETVPVQQSTSMATALAEQGIPFELHIFEKGPHGMSLGTHASVPDKSYINASAAKWISLCHTWLDRQFGEE